MQDTPATRRWRKLAEKQAASGMTVRAFAEAHNVNPKTFNWWRSRLRKLDGEAQPTFTEVVVTPAEATVVLALDELPAHVVVDAGTDLELLRRVVEAFA